MDQDRLPAVISETLSQLQAQDKSSGTSVSEVLLRVCQYEPEVQFQCVVKFRDASATWGCSVDKDPEQALIQAIRAGVRGPVAAKEEYRAMFHLRKEAAEELAEDIQMIYGDKIGAVKIELEPYWGWVAVFFVKDPADLKAMRLTLSGQAEVRNFAEPYQSRATPRASGEKKSSAPKQPKTPKEPRPEGAPKERSANLPKGFDGVDLPEPSEEVAAMNKSALVKKFQEIRGKQPNNALDRTVLAQLVQYMLDNGDPLNV